MSDDAPKDTGRAVKNIALMFTGVALIGVIYADISRRVVPVETDIHGWFEPAGDPVQWPSCFGSDPTNVEIKGQTVPGVGSATVAMKDGLSSVTFATFHGSREIYASVFNSAGKIVLNIERNEFWLDRGEYSFAERPDKSTLTIYDKHGDRFLYLRFAAQNLLVMDGPGANYQTVTIARPCGEISEGSPGDQP